jgi:DMSO/TMAO reductase YedYZ heme-binding membrane subunit
MSNISAAVTHSPQSYPAEARADVASQVRRERRFFAGMAIAMALVCFAGFAPSYYLKTQFGTPQLKPLVHFHGLVFTLWMVLMVVQTSLISAAKVRVHRQLGIAGAVLLVVMVVSGAAVIYGRGTTISPGMPHEAILGFLAIATVALILFPALIGAALVVRKNAATHKRLMMLGTTVFLAAAVHRLLMWLVDPSVTPPLFFGATDLFIVALAVYDFLSRGRVHAATLWGGLAVVISQAGSLVLAGSSSWMTFAHWITGT